MCLIEPLVDAHAQVARPLRGSIITIIGHDEYVEIGSRIIELTEALKQAADQRVPAVPARNQESEKKALREFDPRTGQPGTKALTEPQRPRKEEKVKKGAKDSEVKGNGKKQDQKPGEKLVEPAPTKN